MIGSDALAQTTATAETATSISSNDAVISFWAVLTVVLAALAVMYYVRSE
jgi:hypothetical protein